MKHIKLFESHSRQMADRFKKSWTKAASQSHDISSVKIKEMRAILNSLNDEFSPVAEDDWLEDSDFRDTAIETFIDSGIGRLSQVEFLKLLKPTKEEIKKIIKTVEEFVEDLKGVLEMVEAGRYPASNLPASPEEYQKYITSTSPTILKKLKGML